ncbi:MAG: isochorismatase family protein [Gammaproteobacteria bacterium]|nr:isochorismatase family protein [Gammaproteobacteria bacterium]
MSEIYTRKTYGEMEIGFGERLGLLVVDFQKGFTDARFPMGGGELIDAAVERTATLLELARARGVPVASCYVAYPDETATPYWKVGSVKRDLRRGSEAVELDPRIDAPEHDYVFEKTGASAFFQTPLTSYFVKHRVDTVAIAGCVTSGCVRASVVDSFQFGFRTMLIDDCCGDQEREPHLNTLRDVGRRYADIVSAEQVMNHLNSNSRAPG